MTEVLNQWLIKHPKASMWDKGGKVVDFVSSGHKTKTGFSLVTGRKEYEWSSKSPHNLIYGIKHRHLSPTLHYEPGHLVNFREMCDRYWSWFGKRFVVDA